MKRIGKLLYCSALLLPLTLAGTSRAAITVVDYWRLGEQDPGSAAGLMATNSVDAAGSHPLVFSGSPAYDSGVSTNASAASGSTLCLKFAAGDYGTTTSVSNTVDNFGIEVWVKPDASGTECLAYNGNTGISGWGLYQYNSTFVGLFGGVTFVGSAPSVSGVWTHLALVRDNGVATLYVNGAASGSTSVAPVTPSGGFALGVPPNNLGNERFSGLMDEVRVFTFSPGQFSTNDLLLIQSATNATVTLLPTRFVETGSMATARRRHTTTELPDGRVLVAAGEGTASPYSLNSAEVYTPLFGTWSNAAPLHIPRTGPSATLLRDGRVLVAGGFNFTDGAIGSAELYDPTHDVWSFTAPLTAPRLDHTAVALTNGTVLVLGGRDTNYHVVSATELYDPATGNWTATGSLATARRLHDSTLLADGRVLVAGGQGDSGQTFASVELYYPTSGTWSNAAPLNTGREYLTATLLTNGLVLVVGGYSDGSALTSAEVYNPVTDSWTNTGSLQIARYGHTATLLPNGLVLVTGGLQDTYNSYASAELYDPATGTWSMAASMNVGRRYHRATLLQNGQVLITGGDTGAALTRRAERYLTAATAPFPVGLTRLADGSAQLSFTNLPGALFSVLATSDITQSSSNWSFAGAPIEGPAGHYVWTDFTVTNAAARFYRLRSP